MSEIQRILDLGKKIEECKSKQISMSERRDELKKLYMQVLFADTPGKNAATDTEIKKAYLKLSAKVHPDLNGNTPEANKAFTILGEAKDNSENNFSGIYKAGFLPDFKPAAAAAGCDHGGVPKGGASYKDFDGYFDFNKFFFGGGAHGGGFAHKPKTPVSTPLNDALKTGDIHKVNAALSVGHKPNKYSLTLAVQTVNIAIVKLMIAKGATWSWGNFNSAVAAERNTMDAAFDTGNVDIIIAIINTGATSNTSRVNKAIATKSLAVVQAVLKMGALPQTNSLDYAIKTNDVNIVKALLAAKAKKTINSNAYALATGNAEIITLIVGAVPKPKPVILTVNQAILTNDPTKVAEAISKGMPIGANSLTLAVNQGNIHIILYLISHGAKPDWHTFDNAILLGNKEITLKIINMGAVSATSRVNKAIGTKDVDILKAVLANGALPQFNSLDLAIKSGVPAMVDLIIKAGFKPTASDYATAKAYGNANIIAMIGKFFKPKLTINQAILTNDYNKVYDAYYNDNMPIQADSVLEAVQVGNIEIVNFLIAKNAPVSLDVYDTAFSIGNKAIILALCNYAGKFKAATIINQAVKFKDIEIINAVLTNGKGVPGSIPGSAMSDAVKTGDPKVVQALISAGLSIVFGAGFNMNDYIIPAISTLNVDMVKLLLPYVTQVKVAHLHKAILTEHKDIFDAVLAKADASSVDKKLFLILIIDKKLDKKIDVLHSLLKLGFKPDTDCFGLAVENIDNIDLLKALIEHGAVPGIKSFQYAIKNNKPDVVKLILQNINSKGHNIYKLVADADIKLACDHGMDLKLIMAEIAQNPHPKKDAKDEYKGLSIGGKPNPKPATVVPGHLSSTHGKDDDGDNVDGTDNKSDSSSEVWGSDGVTTPKLANKVFMIGGTIVVVSLLVAGSASALYLLAPATAAAISSCLLAVCTAVTSSISAKTLGLATTGLVLGLAATYLYGSSQSSGLVGGNDRDDCEFIPTSGPSVA